MEKKYMEPSKIAFNIANNIKCNEEDDNISIVIDRQDVASMGDRSVAKDALVKKVGENLKNHFPHGHIQISPNCEKIYITPELPELKSFKKILNENERIEKNEEE